MAQTPTGTETRKISRHEIGARADEWLRALTSFEIELFCDGRPMDKGHALNVLEGPLSTIRHVMDLLARDPDNPPLAAGEITPEEAGTVRPSRDPEARARVLTEMALGALLLQLPGRDEHLDVSGLPAWLQAYSNRIILPVLEIYTEPLLTDSSLLDAYLSTLHQPNRSSHA